MEAQELAELILQTPVDTTWLRESEWFAARLTDKLNVFRMRIADLLDEETRNPSLETVVHTLREWRDADPALLHLEEGKESETIREIVFHIISVMAAELQHSHPDLGNLDDKTWEDAANIAAQDLGFEP